MAVNGCAHTCVCACVRSAGFKKRGKARGSRVRKRSRRQRRASSSEVRTCATQALARHDYAALCIHAHTCGALARAVTRMTALLPPPERTTHTCSAARGVRYGVVLACASAVSTRKGMCMGSTQRLSRRHVWLWAHGACGRVPTRGSPVCGACGGAGRVSCGRHEAQSHQGQHVQRTSPCGVASRAARRCACVARAVAVRVVLVPQRLL